MSSSTEASVPQQSATNYLNSPTIRVVVGEPPDQKEFFVHKDLIYSHSKFFKCAMKKPWKDAEELKVLLPKQEPEIFLLYMEMLYTGAFVEKTATSPLVIFDECLALSKLHVLGEMLTDDQMKEKVLAMIHEKTTELCNKGKVDCLDANCIEAIYEGTPAGSPARRLLVDLYTSCGDGTCEIAKAADLPKDFFFGLAVELLAKRALPKQHTSLKAELATAKGQSASKEKTIQTIQNEVKKLKRDLVDAKARSTPKK